MQTAWVEVGSNLSWNPTVRLQSMIMWVCEFVYVGCCNKTSEIEIVWRVRGCQVCTIPAFVYSI